MTALSPAAERTWVAETLPKVSRTFALSIKLLPAELEHPVAVAYLLCRIADTIEDSPTLPGVVKSQLLREFRESLGNGVLPVGVPATFAQARTADEILTRDVARAQIAFERLPTAMQQAIRPHVQEMCAGMAEFALSRQDSSTLFTLPDIAALDRYCYFVAGTVGHLLTRLFAVHDPRIDGTRLVRLEALDTSFGLGLQLTNIIKDVVDDRRRGWSFVPEDLCRRFEITPDQLIDPAYRTEAAQVMQVLITKARSHLHDALRYCTLLPRSAYGIRLFCLTPVYLAIRTLRLAERDPLLLDPSHKVKITRGAVRRTLATSALIAPSNVLVRCYYGELARA